MPRPVYGFACRLDYNRLECWRRPMALQQVGMRDQVQKIESETLLLVSVRAGVLLVLLMPLIVRTEVLFPFIVGKALYFRTLAEIVFGIWIILVYRYPRYRPPRSWLLLSFAVYLGVALLSGLFGVSVQRSLWSTYERMQGVVDLAHWFLLVLVLTSVFRSMLHWRLVLNVNLAVGLLIALMGVVQHYELFCIPGYDFLLQEKCIRKSGLPEAISRIDVTLGNPTYVGAYMMVNILIGLGFLSQSYKAAPGPPAPRAMQRRRRRRRRTQPRTGSSTVVWWRMFWVTAIAFQSWVFLLSGSRGAAIGLAAGLIAFALGYLVWGRQRSVRLAALSLLGLLAGGVLFVDYSKDSSLGDWVSERSVLVRRLRNVGPDDNNLKDRIFAWSAGLEGFLARPLLGWGPENYIAAWGRYLDEDAVVTVTFDQAHSKPVEELTTKGLLGFIIYSALWVLMSLIVYRRLRKTNDYELLFILFVGAALTGYFVQNLFLFDTPATVLQFMLLLAFVVSLETTIEEPATESPVDRRLRADNAVRQPAGEIGGSRPVAQHRAGWRRLLSLESAAPLARYRLFGQDVVWYGLATTAVVVVIVAIYLLNVRPYNGAKAVAQTATRGLTWEQRLGSFERSIDTFGPLANDARLRMFGTIANNWGSLTDGQAEKVLQVVDREARLALEREPQGWRIYGILAHIYQRAASLDPAHLDQASSYLAEASRLAPRPVQLSRLHERQQSAELQYGEGRNSTVEQVDPAP